MGATQWIARSLSLIRNQERKPWGICIPYEDRHGRVRAFYPDFIIVRSQGDEMRIDLIEPHDLTRDDSWKKAVGLARFADRHGASFGRLLFGVVEDGQPVMVDANDLETRERLRGLTSNEELRNLLV